MWTQSVPTLRYEVSGGDGRTLLLLHEIGGSLHSWDGVVERLGDAFSLVRFDQRGFGDSEKPRASYPPEALIDDVWRVVDAAGGSGPIGIGIVAAAAACATAVAIARAAPERVCGLVLCAPALHIDAATRDAARARADLAAGSGMAGIVDGAMAAMYPMAIRDTAYPDYRDRFRATDPVGFALANRAFADAETVLDGLETPVLVLAGTHDVRPVDVMARWAASAARGRMEIVEDAGHVMAVQQPTAVAGHVARFFDALPGYAGSRSMGGN